MSKKKIEKPIDWSKWTRKELEEVARRYYEITKEKKKREKDNEAKSLSLPLTKKASILFISRSGLYYQRKTPTTKRDLHIEHKISKCFIENHRIYGRDRIASTLDLNYRRVGRYLKALNLNCIVRRKTSKLNEGKLTNVSLSDKVNRDYNKPKVIATDVSYIPTIEGFGYLSIAINHQTKVLESWNFGKNNSTDLVLGHFEKMKIENYIVHSDHGSVYSSQEFVNLAKRKKFTISMSRVGNALDNREAEYFFANLKSEWLNPNETKKLNFHDVKSLINKYINWYNKFRIQSVLGWNSPYNYAKMNLNPS